LNFETFTGPFVWKGDAVWNRPDACHYLSTSDISALRQALKREDLAGAAAHVIHPEVFQMPELDGVLGKARQELENGCGVFRLRNLDLCGLDVKAVERIFRLLTCQIGTPISQSASGETLFHVCDAGFPAGHSQARGPNTRQGLSFHTDRCDIIAFACVRQALAGGENLLVSAAALHNHLLQERPDLLRQLYQPFIWKRHNIDTGNQRPWCELPIFAPWKGKFMGNIMRVLIERGHQLPNIPNLTVLQREALDTLESLARRPEFHTRFLQQPGDLLFVNNLLVWHSREPFQDAAEPDRKRLLLRIWLATAFSRELDPIYAGLYGHSQAGILRGGIHPPNPA